MNVNLEVYRIFYTVAKCHSFTLAAEELCISQPAVSQAIKGLETNLKSKLFIRTPKGVKLTKEGEVLYSYVNRGYDYFKMGEELFQKMIDLENGEIRIGASDMTLEFYLLPFLEEFHLHYPSIKVQVTNAPTPETLDYLYEGKIDFGIVSEPFSAKQDIKITRVKEIQDCFIAGKRFAYLKDEVLSLEKLKELPIICLEEKTSTRRYVDEFLQSKSVILKPEFELATSDMIVKFVMRNMGIGSVVENFAKPYVEDESLFLLQFEDEIPKRNFCVITSEQNPISTAARQLLRMMGLED